LRRSSELVFTQQCREKMIIAVSFTFLGFAFAIALGLLGAWLMGHVGAFVGIGLGLGVSFLATAYVAGR